jgi:hypothetical protein
MKKNLLILVVILLSLFLLSGCKSDEAAPVPDASGEKAGDTTLPGYPAPDSTIPEETMPGYPAPAGAPVRENASRMNVEVLSLAQSEKNSEYVVMHVRVNSTAPVDGMDEYDANLAGQEVDITLAVGDAVSLAPGDIINLTVSYRGDEWGGGYYGTEISYEK